MAGQVIPDENRIDVRSRQVERQKEYDECGRLDVCAPGLDFQDFDPCPALAIGDDQEAVRAIRRLEAR